MKKEKQKKGWKRELLEWGICLLGAVVIALPVRAFVFEPYKVEGRSMETTLYNAEVMFTTKFDYLFSGPNRFDVVICNYEGRTEHFVKRVVGLPGDTVAIRDGYLYVNGEKHEETYLSQLIAYNMDETTVPENEYFVLGDNRNNSNDSHILGPLKRNQIVSHVRAVLFPFNQIRSIN